MTVVVENSADQVTAYTTGNGVFPVPPEVKADNEAQAKKGEEKVEPKAEEKVETKEEPKPEAKDADDVEGEDGLTPRQKREFTEKMRATINKKHRAQKEAEELAATQYAERKLAQEEAARLAKENAELKAKLTPPKTTDDAPKREDFKDDQAFWDAMVDYRVEKKLKAEQAAQTQAAEQERQERIQAEAGSRLEKARELVPDYDEVVAEADFRVPTFVAAYLQESDMIAELGYHFAQHPEVLERLAKITDGVPEGSSRFRQAVTKQLVELGKIESTLKPFAKTSVAKDDEDAPEASRETAKEPSTETGSSPSKPRIAPVIRPLNGGSAAQVEKDEADMTGSQVITSWQRKHGVRLTDRKRH